MIDRKNVQWSILDSVQKFLVGTKDESGSVDYLKECMMETILILCKLQSMYGLEIETSLEFSKALGNCSDMYELLNKISEEIHDELIIGKY